VTKDINAITPEYFKYRLEQETEQYKQETEQYKQETEQYKQEIEKLQNQLQQKENIIKEVREYIEMHTPSDIGICGNKTKRYYTLGEDSVDHILEILDKGE